MATKDPYKPAPKQSEIPKAICQRAAWYLNSIGKDIRDPESKTRFGHFYEAYTTLNIPIMCRDVKLSDRERKLGMRMKECSCYPPLSGLSGKGKRRKGGRRR